jgi:hypothetical protein
LEGNAKVTINNGTVADAIKVYETLTKAGIQVELGPKMEKMFRAAANGDREALHILDPMGNTDFRSLSKMGATARGILADKGIDYTKPVATKEPVEQDGSSPSHLGDRMRGVSDAYTTDSVHQRDGSTHPPITHQKKEAERIARETGGIPDPVPVVDPKAKALAQIGDIASSLTKLTEAGGSFSSLSASSPERESLRGCIETMGDIRDSIAGGGALPTQLQIDAIKATIAAMKTNPASVNTLKEKVDDLARPSPSSPSPLDL